MTHEHRYWPVHFALLWGETFLRFGHGAQTFYLCKCGEQGFPI